MGMVNMYDCIVIGAGPGGLQAAIHLARYNRQVLLLDKGGGRTRHAKRLENYLGLKLVTGVELIDTGLAQIENFGVQVTKETVQKLEQGDHGFVVMTDQGDHRAQFVIASSGARENLPRLRNLNKHFARNFFTCVDCDGYHTIGKKLLIMGGSINMVRLAFGMQQMFTKDITVLPVDYEIPEDYMELLRDDRIILETGRPVELIGEKALEGVKLEDGRIIGCEAIMASFGLTLNDAYLKDLNLERDAQGFKYLTHNNYESSLPGLYILGALKQGHAQAVIAAGQGAATAIDINQRLLEL